MSAELLADIVIFLACAYIVIAPAYAMMMASEAKEVTLELYRRVEKLEDDARDLE